MKELLKKLHRYEIEIRKALLSHMQGDFHSLFKGSGIEFDDVRPYQYGDDIRTINWNLSAKGHGTYIKTFKEEKEQQVFFVVDVSASQKIGRTNEQKITIAKEIASVLALTALKEQSQTGLICFSDRKELYIPPAKGMKQAHFFIHKLFELQPQSKKTNLTQAFQFLLHQIKKRSVIIFISDFVDQGYEKFLRGTASKHDLVLIQIAHPNEKIIPSLGIIPLYDEENNKEIWMNTSSVVFKNQNQKRVDMYQQEIEQLAKKANANYVSIQTTEYYVPKLIHLFKIRNRKRKK